jgi:hypothetical protein
MLIATDDAMYARFKSAVMASRTFPSPPSLSHIRMAQQDPILSKLTIDDGVPIGIPRSSSYTESRPADATPASTSIEIIVTDERNWARCAQPHYLTPDDIEDDVAREHARNAQDKAGDTTLAFGQDGEPRGIVRRSTWQSWSQSGQVTRVHGSDKR